MKIEIIAIGDELICGRILNTTSSFAARHLCQAGYEIVAMHTIGDDPAHIGELLKAAVEHADAVLVTGGLGSTDDDLTNEAVSSALNRPAELNHEILAHLHRNLPSINSSSAGKFEKLALLPGGAEVLNPAARISGYRLIHKGKPIYFLPGIPAQMEQLMLGHVLPSLARWNKNYSLTTCQRIFKVFGPSELEVNERIAKLHLHESVAIGYYPVFPEVHLSLIVRDRDDTTAHRVFNETCELIYTALGDAIYGYDTENLETVVGRMLLEQSLTLGLAESCTGGLIGERLTRVSGSSSYFLGGIISYDNSVKTNLLHVSDQLLAEHGAVSHAVAQQMALGARNACKADICLAVTGIAGPGGGSSDKPVGTVFIGLSTRNDLSAYRFQFFGDREQIRLMSAFSALNIMRKYLLKS